MYILSYHRRSASAGVTSPTFLFIVIVLTLSFAYPPLTWAFDTRIHDDITRERLTPMGFDEDSADEVADSCEHTDIAEFSNEAAHADNNKLGLASERLKGKLQEITVALENCQRRTALDRLGQALHTVQDVYAHSNWIENNHMIPDLLGMKDGTAFCDSAKGFAPDGLVTGYYFKIHDQCQGMPLGMCCHLDLNKDDEDERNGKKYPQAAEAAKKATDHYVDLFEEKVRAKFSADKADFFMKMVKQKQRKAYFVIDDTGSMWDDIERVKSEVNSMLNNMAHDKGAPTLGLVTFKDDVSVRGDFCDLDSFRSTINSLYASGGGDCPEASNAALLAALNQIPIPLRTDVQLRGGDIYLFTDASSGDAYKGPIVASYAFSKGVAIHAVLTGDCVAETSSLSGKTASLDPVSAQLTVSDNDPSNPSTPVTAPRTIAPTETDDLTSPSARTQLRALTQATGGTLFQVYRSEVDDIVPTLLELSDPGTANLLSRRLDLNGTVSLEVPADETLTNLTFMIALSSPGVLPNVAIIRPNGSPVNLSDSDVRRLLLTSVVTYTLSTPQVGAWRMELQGTGRYVARVYGNASLDVNQLRFIDLVAPRPRPEVDFMPLEGQPVAGEEATADLRMKQQPVVSTVNLRRPDGELLLALTPATTDQRYFRLNFIVPDQSFLMQVVGTSQGGNAFVREVVVPITPQTVAISVTPKQVITAPGGTAKLAVTVRNAYGESATYRLRANSSLGWGVTVPSNFLVESGKSATVNVEVKLPLSAMPGTQDDLTLLVENVDVPTVRNSTSASVLVALNQIPVCDTAYAEPNKIWPPNFNFTSVAILGVSDPDNDPLILSVTGITQDEPVVGPGSGNKQPDAEGLGTSSPKVRAERDGGGDGRVYAISFTADDQRGGQCAATVNVSVPHDAARPAIDSGQIYNSVVPAK